MARSALRLVMVCAVASTLALSCKKPPPKVPEPEPEPVAAVEPPKPEPPPPPKCESFVEKCVADAESTVTVGDQAGTFKPPVGWTFAKMESSSVAKTDEGAAVIGFRVVEAPLDAKQNPDAIATALAPLLAEVGVTDVTDKVIVKRVKKPPVEEQAGTLALKTWDLAGKVAGEDGMLLVIVTTEGGLSIVGVVAMQKNVVEQHGKAARDAYLSLRGAK